MLLEGIPFIKICKLDSPSISGCWAFLVLGFLILAKTGTCGCVEVDVVALAR